MLFFSKKEVVKRTNEINLIKNLLMQVFLFILILAMANQINAKRRKDTTRNTIDPFRDILISRFKTW